MRDTELQQEVRVVNSGTEDLGFTAALHSYFRVGDITQVWRPASFPVLVSSFPARLQLALDHRTSLLILRRRQPPGGHLVCMHLLLGIVLTWK